MADTPTSRRIIRKLNSLLGITSSNSRSQYAREARMKQSLELTYSTARECGYLVQITLIPYEALALMVSSSTNMLNADHHYGEPFSVLH